ncbi:hypothetical protein [Arthrobacter sp. MAHUQ-56]
MTLGDATPNVVRQPWAFAAVCVMVLTLTMLISSLMGGSVPKLLPWYVAGYLLIGVCIFGPAGRFPSLRQAVVFLLPGALLVVLSLWDQGVWAGGWLLGVPAWGLLLSRWTPGNPLQLLQVLKFLGLLALGLVIFTFNVVYPIPSLGLFVLPLIPLIRLAYPDYRARPVQAAVDVLFGFATVWIVFSIPTPEGSWSSPWTLAGGAATVGLMIAFGVRDTPLRSRRLQPNDGAIV